jgi:sulfatase modifying factor 1
VSPRCAARSVRWGLLAVAAVLPAGGSAEPATGTAVKVAGGTIRMGTPAAAVSGLKARFSLRFPGAFETEVPDHAVTVSGFRMDRCEVTNRRFAEFVAARPDWARERLPATMQNGHYLEHWSDTTVRSARADHPVVFVTWHAAQAFCRWAGGRLPTEAEWEYAARAGADVEFPWGDQLPTAARANYSASGFGDTRPVGSYPANRLGLHDMAGNVWEFLLDAWEPSYVAEAQVNPIAGGPVPDATLRSVSGRRVVRGGSYDGGIVNLRTRWRDSHVVTNAVAFVGFRCVYPDGEGVR